MSQRVGFIGVGLMGHGMAKNLLEKGYRVYGLMRRSSSFNTGRIDHLYQDPHDPDPRLQLVYGDRLLTFCFSPRVLPSVGLIAQSSAR